MSNKKQTAVDLAFEWFDNIIPFVNNEKAKEFNDKKIELKAMEKEQHKQSYWESLMSKYQTFEQYYKETYES